MGGWSTVICKKTMQLLRRLRQMPSIMWKDPITMQSILPKSQSSSSKALKKKSRRLKKRKRKKFISPTMPKDRTDVEKYINSLEEYKQELPKLIKLQYFITEDM